jgi:hypothetical protein
MIGKRGTGKCEKCGHLNRVHHRMLAEPFKVFCDECHDDITEHAGQCWPYEMTPEYSKAQAAAKKVDP